MSFRPYMRGLLGSTAFTPASIFASGEQGAWYDPSDLTTLYQDSAGTTPVTADGDPVGYMGDKSGSGNHVTQSTSAARPVYRTDGTLHWLEFDGVDDYLVNSSPSGLTTPFDSVSSFVAGEAFSTGQKGLFVASDNVLGGGDKFVLFRPAGSTSGVSDASSYISHSFGLGTSTPFIAGILFGPSAHSFRLDGTEVASGAGLSNSMVLDNRVVVGASSTSTQFWIGKFFGGLLTNDALTTTEQGNFESYLAGKSGVTL